ncbi:MAG: hypothetical protein GY953_58955, partial [bacterium]|nr:hypothetical protein [bacterium]
MVCFGEGEYLSVALAERLADGRHWQTISDGEIPGLILRREMRTPMSPVENRQAFGAPVTDTSQIPIPDYSFDGSHFIADAHRGILPLTAAALQTEIDGDYYVAPTRGCPYKCTYCIDNLYHTIYEPKQRFRRRDMETVMAELIWARQNIPGITRV